MSLFQKMASACRSQDAEALPLNCVLLDVRNQAEYQSGAIDGALWVPLALLPVQIAEQIPDRATPIVAYCAAGGRSAMACMVLQQMGYQQVVNGGGVQQLARRIGRGIVVPPT